MSDKIRVEIADHVATVTLNRAEKRNAVDLEMFEALKRAGDDIANDGSVRAVILGAEGDHFCAGIDISVFEGAGIGAVGAARMQPLEDTPSNFFQAAAYVWREVPVPVIAAIEGVAFGAGLQIAAGADVRYARPDAQFSVMEIKWGLIPDLAISATLRDAVAVDRLKELAWSGRVIDGVEADRIGLVTAVCDDPVAQARQLALDVAGKSPDAIRSIKRLITDGWKQSPEQSLRLEAELQTRVMGGPNQTEAARANIERRRPLFRDPD